MTAGGLATCRSGPAQLTSYRTLMLVMEVIVRLQDRVLCASITCITGTYAEPEGRVIFDHRHNASDRAHSLAA